MKLLFVIPAIFAEFSAGKLNILGGDFNTLNYDEFPASQLTLAIIGRIQAEAEESHAVHHIRIVISNQERHAIAPDGNLEIQPEQFVERVGEEHKTVGIVLNYQGIVFPKPDVYTFHILADESELGQVSIDVVESNVLSLPKVTAIADSKKDLGEN